jgi:cysteine desulfurase/selenocysteine lyase
MTAVQTSALALNPRPADAGDGAHLDVERVRQEFPILAERPYGKPLVYLDSAATSQKPQAVIDAMSAFYSRDNANVHRGVHYLSERATEAYEAARAKVGGFLNAAHASEIVFTRGTTEAINLVAQTYAGTHLGEGDEVLITAMEHHSNIVPWQMVCEQRGARLRVAPISDAGELLVDELEELIGPSTKLGGHPRLQRARHDQPDPAHHRHRPRPGRSRARRRRPGGPAPRHRRPGAGL